MSLKLRLNNEMHEAMKAGDKMRSGTIRMINSAIKQKEIDGRLQLDDGGVLDIINKMKKQYLESIKQFDAAGREDLTIKEQSEMEIVESFLPKPYTQEEIKSKIDDLMKQAKPEGIKDLGKVMGLAKTALGTRADMKFVSEEIRKRLS